LVWIGSIMIFIGLFIATFRRTEKPIASWAARKN
jgi:hypothetical protein